jgi:hypothetical protein
MNKPRFEDCDLNTSGDAVWVHAEQLHLCITRTDEGIVWDMYAGEQGTPMDIIDTGYTFFNETENQTGYTCTGCALTQGKGNGQCYECGGWLEEDKDGDT